MPAPRLGPCPPLRCIDHLQVQLYLAGKILERYKAFYSTRHVYGSNQLASRHMLTQNLGPLALGLALHYDACWITSPSLGPHRPLLSPTVASIPFREIIKRSKTFYLTRYPYVYRWSQLASWHRPTPSLRRCPPLSSCRMICYCKHTLEGKYKKRNKAVYSIFKKYLKTWVF